jgi:hypothetical protein
MRERRLGERGEGELNEGEDAGRRGSLAPEDLETRIQRLKVRTLEAGCGQRVSSKGGTRQNSPFFGDGARYCGLTSNHTRWAPAL